MKFKKYINENKKSLNMKIGKLKNKKEIKDALLTFLSDGTELYGTKIADWGINNTTWKRSDTIKEKLRIILQELEKENKVISNVEKKIGYKYEVRVWKIKE